MARDANDWKVIFDNWPRDTPRSGVVVSSFDEQILFVEFLTTSEFVLLERRAPDAVGARKVIIPYSEIRAVKIVEPVKLEVFEPLGFEGARPAPQSQMRSIYLDYNATTPVAESVREAMEPFFGRYYGNPSSSHAIGRACQEAIEDARNHLAAFLGCTSDEIVFTSGGTESNNLAIKGVLMRDARTSGAHLVVSAIEHPAVSEPARFLSRIGFQVSVVPCSPQGIVSAEEIERAIRPDTVLVSIMHANNEVGSIQPIREIADVCHARKVLLHTDAAQSFGKIETRVDVLDVDFLTIAGHKIYAPKGIGALYVRQGVHLEPFMHGAGHEGGLRSGTENVPYIVGLGQAAKLASRNLMDATERISALRDYLFELLRDGIGDGLVVHAGNVSRLPSTLSVSFPGVWGGDLLAKAPELCASTGAACHSGMTHMSPTLEAMGVPKEVARGTVRLSAGWNTTQEDVERAANLLIAAWDSLRGAE